MINRDGVIAILTGLASETADVEGAADRILALVRPVGGVTLTPEEVAVALRWRRTQWENGSFYGYEDERLAARLEEPPGLTDAEASR